MATTTEVLSFLRTLTSNSSNAAPAEKKTEFDEILLSNMERLKNSLREKGKFPWMQQRLEIRTNAHMEESQKSDQAFDGSTEVCKKCNSDKENLKKESKSEKADVIHLKDAIRWTFVETCLELLKQLKEALIDVITEENASNQKTDQKGGKRRNEAPPLPADALGVADQKAVLTAIQFVVVLGICPNLMSGVGLPVEKRSGFASILNIHCSIKSERRLFDCVNALVDCIAQPSLGALVLSRHLGDVLAGLIQLCYAPVSAYSDNKTGSTASTDLKSDYCGTNLSRNLHNHSCEDSSTAVKNPDDLTKVDANAEPLVKDSCDALEPSDFYMLNQNPQNGTEDNHQKFFITLSERENCGQNLQRILDRVYQPMVIRELLMLQGGFLHAEKQPGKNNSGKATSSVNNGKSAGSSGGNCSGLQVQTPKWMKNVCGQLLSERLMKPNGIKAVLHALFEGSAGAISSPDWKKCDIIAKVIANCPSQVESVEEYYKLVSPQVLQLLHGQNKGVGRLYIRTASSIIMEMLTQYPELAQKYVLSPMTGPLAQTTQSQGERAGGTVVDENKVIKCVEDIHKVFVSGSHRSEVKILLPIVHPVFELFCFTRKGVSHLRSALREILVHVLKGAEPYEVLQLLYSLAFKISPPKNLASSKPASNSNTDHSDDKENVILPFMNENYVFAHGDNGGVMIRYQNDGADKHYDRDSILRGLQGDDLSGSEVQAVCIVELLSELKRDSMAGDFFICLMQELTNIISDFSENIGCGDMQHSLVILHLVALMCEKLGPSILTDTPQIVAFIESTLQRACAIIQADEQGLGAVFVTETLTQALGMLSAVLGGAVEMKKEHRPLVQHLMPLLETLTEQHPSVELKDMANDLRIAIATHGAVWSHKVDAAAKHLGKETDAVKVDSDHAITKEKESIKEKDESCSVSQTEASPEFDEAFSQLCDPLLPVRGHAMLTLASLIRHRDPKAVQATDTLLKVFLEQLSHDDSYIYLAGIQGLVSLADVRADTVIPQLAREFATCGKGAGITSGATKEINEKGYYKQSDKVSRGSSRPTRSPELRMKIGEALVKATRICGELVPRYSQHLLPALLTGVKDPEPLVRASSLSNLGDVCQLLRFSLGPVVNEIFSCVSALLKTDKSAEVRRSAVLVLTLLLRGLGKSIMEVLSSTLKEIYQLLKIVESTDADHVTRVHAQAALGELDTITRDYLFPEPSLTKRIQVLP